MLYHLQILMMSWLTTQASHSAITANWLLTSSRHGQSGQVCYDKDYPRDSEYCLYDVMFERIISSRHLEIEKLVQSIIRCTTSFAASWSVISNWTTLNTWSWWTVSRNNMSISELQRMEFKQGTFQIFLRLDLGWREIISVAGIDV